MPVPDDPDLARLFELLRMLPGPRDDPGFWTDVQHQVLGSNTSLGYVFEKMSGIWRTVQDPSPQHIEDLARYLLFFFAGENPAMWKTLNAVVHGEITMRNDEPGRWWASDLCDTAWTLYVRYRRRPGDQWALKWQYEKDWRELLPPRDQR